MLWRNGVHHEHHFSCESDAPKFREGKKQFRIRLHPWVCPHCVGVHHPCHVLAQIQNSVRKSRKPNWCAGEGGAEVCCSFPCRLHLLFTATATASRQQLHASSLHWCGIELCHCIPRSAGSSGQCSSNREASAWELMWSHWRKVDRVNAHPPLRVFRVWGWQVIHSWTS